MGPVAGAFAILALLGLPMFVFGVLGYKCFTYISPKYLRASISSRILTPLVFGIPTFVLNTIILVSEPPIIPHQWGWPFLMWTCIADVGLFVLWMFLKVREVRRKRREVRGNSA